MQTRQFLDTVYDLSDLTDTESLYDNWAATYDAETAKNGYVTPGRCAEALASLVEDRSAPIVDIGCGTGLSGLAFRKVGFDTLDGVDLSAEMLARAGEHGCYRALHQGLLSDVIHVDRDGEAPYAHAAAVGVLNPGHAPAETILDAFNVIQPGGVFIFSLNDHALADPSYEARINDVVDCGAASVVFKEYGPHLPARELNAMVYGLRKR